MSQLTMQDIAQLAQVKVSTVRSWRHRSKTRAHHERFPLPAGMLGRTPWWTADVVQLWLATRRGPGRPSRDTGESTATNERSRYR